MNCVPKKLIYIIFLIESCNKLQVSSLIRCRRKTVTKRIIVINALFPLCSFSSSHFVHIFVQLSNVSLSVLLKRRVICRFIKAVISTFGLFSFHSTRF